MDFKPGHSGLVVWHPPSMQEVVSSTLFVDFYLNFFLQVFTFLGVRGKVRV